MNIESVLHSSALIKRFCTDTRMPITVYSDPYFTQRLLELDYFYGGVRKFIDFCAMLSDFDNEQDYFAYYNSVKDSVINHIKGHESFVAFGKKNVPHAGINRPPKKELYTPENDGKEFISIDLRKANFSIVKENCPGIFGDCETWEDFLDGFTKYGFIKESKYIRQVIFGACNPKRQIQFETEKMEILAWLINADLHNVELYSVKADEIILVGSGREDLQSVIDFVETTRYKDDVRIECFKLKKVGKYGYAKYMYLYERDGKSIYFPIPELKCFDSETIHQVARYFLHREIIKDDLVFYHNGRLAKFLEPIENPWKDE